MGYLVFQICFFNFWFLLAYFLSIFDPKNLSKINQKILIFGLNGKMIPREPSGASKNQKAAFSKTSKKPPVFGGFWVRRPPKRASRDPRRLSRGTQRAPKPPKKIQKVIKKLVKNSTKNDQKVTKKLGPKRGSFLKKSL